MKFFPSKRTSPEDTQPLFYKTNFKKTLLYDICCRFYLIQIQTISILCIDQQDMKLLAILVCSLIVLHISAQNYEGILALSWPAGHCEYLEGLGTGRRCDATLMAPWNRRRFTIHGYWAQGRSNQDFGGFNEAAVRPLLKQLNLYWPPSCQAHRNPSRPTFREKYGLWIHEWEKHGKDFATAYIRLTGGRGLSSNQQTRNIEIQRIFFSETLKLYKRYQLSGLRSRPATKNDLAAALKVPIGSLITRCLPSGNIQEIRVCVRMQLNAQTNQVVFVESTCRSGNNCKTNSISLKDFK